MKKFSEMNIKVGPSNIFDAKQVRITDILNRVVKVIDFQTNIKTEFGPDRYIVMVEVDGARKKFFTDSSRMKEQLDKVQREDFPFIATISILSFGERKRTYYFT